MERNKINYRWGIATLLSILSIELLLDNVLMTNSCVDFSVLKTNCILQVKVVLLIIIVLLLCVSVFINRKYIKFWKDKSEKKYDRWKRFKEVLTTLIKNSVSGGMLDLLFVVFFLLHLTWIPDSIFDFVKNDPDINLLARIVHPCIYIVGLLLVIYLKPQIPKDESGEIQLLLTGISNISFHPKFGSNLIPFIEPFKRHDKIKHIVVFFDEKIEYKESEENRAFLEEKGVSSTLLDKINSNNSLLNESLLKEFLCQILKNKIEEGDIELIKCDYNDLKSMYRAVADEVNNIIENTHFSDNNMLFNLTPGTTNTSISLALNSVKGKRKLCYLSQDEKQTDKYKELDLDIFEIKDIFSELTD